MKRYENLEGWRGKVPWWRRFLAWARARQLAFKQWLFERELQGKKLIGPDAPADEETPLESQAKEALARVIFETDIPPDCVEATTAFGGPCIKVKHDEAWEAIIHETYEQAADQAILFIKDQGEYLETAKTAAQGPMNRAQRRRFDKERKKGRKKKLTREGRTLH